MPASTAVTSRSAHSLTFDAVAEATPGARWRARWDRSWSAYEAWFVARGGDHGPDRASCEAALQEHMPELVPVHRALSQLAGNTDRAARFLSTWCPPEYLGGCSLAALAAKGEVRLVRNYDLAPTLNEGLLLRSEWTGTPVMGMSEFLWGLSDGVNARGLAAALAFGGRSEVGPGFGITTIVRYVLETCATVEEALKVLHRVPSHMAYNITLADRNGDTATIELHPAGRARQVEPAIATNHQHGVSTAGVSGAVTADRPGFTRTVERRDELSDLLAQGITLDALADAFLCEPLFQRNYDGGFGTLFTAVYDPAAGDLTLRWPDQEWRQSLADFAPGSRTIHYDGVLAPTPTLPAGIDLSHMLAALRPHLSKVSQDALDAWVKRTMHDAAGGGATGGAATNWGATNWVEFAEAMQKGWR